MSFYYLIGGLVLLLAIMAVHQALALVNVQRQVSENGIRHSEEIQTLRKMVLGHINSETDDGK